MKLIGNEDIFKQLEVAVVSAQTENKSIPHILLSGAAGCGKTSIARFVAETFGGDFIEVTPESIQDRNDMLRIKRLLNREGYNYIGDIVNQIRPTVVFIDEVHRLKITGQEHLGLAMENWAIPVEEKQVRVSLSGKFGYNLKGRIRWCPRFTLIGATTNDGLLSKPFKDRFKLRFLLNIYSLEESIEIIRVHARRLNEANAKRKAMDGTKRITLTYEAVKEISKRGRGVPRILVALLERCRDMAISHGMDVVDETMAVATFILLGIDESGLTQVDIKLMTSLYESEDPIGLDNLAIIINESKQTIKDTIEPHLIQEGLVSRAQRGRVLTSKGRRYLMENGLIEYDEGEDFIDIPATYERRI